LAVAPSHLIERQGHFRPRRLIGREPV